MLQEKKNNLFLFFSRQSIGSTKTKKKDIVQKESFKTESTKAQECEHHIF